MISLGIGVMVWATVEEARSGGDHGAYATWAVQGSLEVSMFWVSGLRAAGLIVIQDSDFRLCYLGNRESRESAEVRNLEDREAIGEIRTHFEQRSGSHVSWVMAAEGSDHRVVFGAKGFRSASGLESAASGPSA